MYTFMHLAIPDRAFDKNRKVLRTGPGLMHGYVWGVSLLDLFWLCLILWQASELSIRLGNMSWLGLEKAGKQKEWVGGNFVATTVNPPI